MLSPDEKSDIRRHLRAGAIAVNRYGPNVGQLRNLVINDGLYHLESRLDELSLVDEAKLTGACLGSVVVAGLDPVAGNSVSIVVDSADLVAPVTVNWTAPTNLSRFDLAVQLSSLLGANSSLAQAGIQSSGPWQGGVDKNLQPVIELKAARPFTLTAGYAGQASLMVVSQGEHVEPSAVVAKRLGVETVKYGYVPILNYLTGAIAGVTRNADVARAGSYSRGRELRERKDILAFWRHELKVFLFPNEGGGGFSL